MTPWKRIWTRGPFSWWRHDSGVGRRLILHTRRAYIVLGTTPQQERVQP